MTKIPLFSISQEKLLRFADSVEKHTPTAIALILSAVSVIFFYFFYSNHLGLAYNDARSHLDIGRRVVEGLKPGLAQIGSVWLPLPHLLMIPTIWNDFMWHSGLSGALQNMIAFVGTGLLIYQYLKQLRVGWLGRVIAVLVFAANLNVLYLQSTAMTELLLIGTMMAGIYYLLLWSKDDNILNLIKSSAWIMLSTLIRYDGWFLFLMASAIIVFQILKTRGYKVAEGMFIFFATVAGLGIVLWFVWNLVIFKDPLYFALGPFSAHAQQRQLEEAGDLLTKKNLNLSVMMYLFASIYNTTGFVAVVGFVGVIAMWLDKHLHWQVRLASVALVAPLIFNILALYLGHSVLFIQGVSGNSWFNVRYGVMVLPSVAVGIGYLVQKAKKIRWVLIGCLMLTLFIAFSSADAVTIDDARVGSSQKNVSEVSNYLATHTKNEAGFILISVASHDATIFSSGLPMKKFIHEGTGAYWESAIAAPDRWARWIVVRTHDDNDLTWKMIKDTPGFQRFKLVGEHPFADIYELKPEYLGDLNTQPVFGKQK